MSQVPPLTPPSPAGPFPAQDRTHQAPADDEVVYYQGSPPPRGLGAKMLLWPLAGAVMLVLPLNIHMTGLHAAACIFMGFGLAMLPGFWAKTIRYRITNYRIDYERGVLSRDIDTLELWHVEDIHFHQSPWDRLLRVGSIRITSRDEKIPELLLRGLPRPRPLYDTLKQRVIAVKRARGVIKVDPG
jgi:membrane protein YdbS with pleckstrin-like domain